MKRSSATRQRLHFSAAQPQFLPLLLASTSSSSSSPPPPSLPPTPAAYPPDLTAWFCPGAFDLASGTWRDCGGNGNTAALSGSGLAELRRAGHGATGEVLALSGTTSSVIDFGPVSYTHLTLPTKA